MKKQLLSVVLATTLGMSGLYAFGGCEGKKEGIKQPQMMKMQMHKKEGFRSVMRTLSQLDLSQSQWTQVKKSILTMKMHNLQNAPQKKMSDFFSQEGFDKKGYMGYKRSLMATKLESEAQMIEEVTALLTKSQLETFQNKLQTPHPANKGGKRCDK